MEVQDKNSFDPSEGNFNFSKNIYNKIGMDDFEQTQQNLIRHQQLNPHLYKRGPTKYQKQQNINPGVKQKGHWTEKEDSMLTKAVDENQGKNWKKIAESLSGRTDV